MLAEQFWVCNVSHSLEDPVCTDISIKYLLKVKSCLLPDDVCQFPEDGILHKGRFAALPCQAITATHRETNQLL